MPWRARKPRFPERSHHRWRKEYGGSQVDQARRLKELERENGRSRRLVAKVAFTGGDVTGAAVYAAAKGIKHVTLELGGKSSNIVFADANLDDAANGAVSGIFAASGQTCIAGSRLLAQRSVCEEVSARLVAFAGRARVGDPVQRSTQVGPITAEPQRAKVLEYIGIARDEGARCLLGGGKPNGPELADGWFVEPTIFGDVSNDMRIAREDVFGPVLSIIPFEDEDEAVEIANGSAAASVVGTAKVRSTNTCGRRASGSTWPGRFRTRS